MESGKGAGVIPEVGKLAGKSGATGGEQVGKNSGSTRGKGGGRKKGAVNDSSNIRLADIAAEIPVAKPKKKKRSKGNKEFAENLAVLLSTTFTIIGQKNVIWQLTENEVTAIADPLANVLEKYVPAEKANDYSSVVQLLAAVGFIIVPRVILTAQEKKAKTGKGSIKNAEQVRNSSDSVNKPTSSTGAGHDDGLFPALAF